MKVFISWSGDKSLAVAEILKSWLPSVLQALDEVWMSDDDLRSGANWSASIGEQLSTTDFGIVCVTQHNQDRPWLNFEAGAISKLTGGCVPLLIDFPDRTDLHQGPMSQLQVRMAQRPDIERLVRDMNERLPRPLPTDVLATTFNRAYPEFQTALGAVLTNPDFATAPEKRGVDDKVGEVLSIIREMSRQSSTRAPYAFRAGERFGTTSAYDMFVDTVSRNAKRWGIFEELVVTPHHDGGISFSLDELEFTSEQQQRLAMTAKRYGFAPVVFETRTAIRFSKDGPGAEEIVEHRHGVEEF